MYKIFKIINLPNSHYITGFCMLNERMFLPQEYLGTIREWIIEGDNIKLIFEKENAHNKIIFTLVKLGKGNIASCSEESIKIW